jgi:putative transposase
MKDIGSQEIIRGEPHRTTIADKTASCSSDKVNRLFRLPAPNKLRVSNFTYVATWIGFVYVAFVVDAQEQAVHDGRLGKGMALVHHSNVGSHYLSIKYT